MYALAKLQYITHIPVKHKTSTETALAMRARSSCCCFVEQFLPYLYEAVSIIFQQNDQ
jgi:hypothetical protein